MMLSCSSFHDGYYYFVLESFLFFAFVLLYAAENNWCAFIRILLAGNKIQLVDLAFFLFCICI